jgi:glycosyltransferase involved in cell wall biosynthesis
MARGRAAADVVVPFRGSDSERARVLEGLSRLELADGDTVVLVDNGPSTPPPHPWVLHAPGVSSSYYARNEGARRGTADWIIFIDADARPVPDLLDRYLIGEAAPGVGLLAGGVFDEQPSDGVRPSPVSRYAGLKAAMAQDNTMRDDGRGYAQTANVAVRRAAFDAVGGFRSDIRSGGDADFCFRLQAAGWRLDRRYDARVTHRNRTTLAALARQRARHGSGAAWLNRRYPGAFPPVRSLGTVKWSLEELVRAARAALGGDTEAALLASIDVVSHWAFEVGRLVPNEARTHP